MARRLQAGETVFVPWARTGHDGRGPSALATATVAELRGKKVVLALPGGALSPEIGSSLVHRAAAVLILRVGDLQTELGLLDPLAKSLLQYLRLPLAGRHCPPIGAALVGLESVSGKGWSRIAAAGGRTHNGRGRCHGIYGVFWAGDAINMPANLILLVWMLTLGVSMWRRSEGDSSSHP